MSLWSWAKRVVGLGPSRRETELTRLHNELADARANIRRIQANYDAAAMTDETFGLWAKADGWSARRANILEVRKPLRERSRHEDANGSHMQGITATLTNDMIGTGAALQVLLEDDAMCDAVESRWDEWADEILLDEKLHTFCHDEVVSGEGVGLIFNNDMLDCPVKLDLQTLECDLLSTPFTRIMQGGGLIDGIVFDKYGCPTTYHLLDNHPGDYGVFNPNGFREVPARDVLHFFRASRSGQCRGIPILTPSLFIFAHLREYSDAVLKAARVAACITAIISTNQNPSQRFTSSELTSTDIEPGMILAAPDGYNGVSQMKSEQPITTYDAYERTKLGEACHAANLPYSVGTGDFSRESYAGGRMSRQVYHAAVGVRRHHFSKAMLSKKLFNRWQYEARRIPGYLPANLPDKIPHTWFYDPWEHIDETKAADAITTNLANNTTTLAEECAKRKKDWRAVIRQRGREKRALEAEGLSSDAVNPGADVRREERQMEEAADIEAHDRRLRAA
jgi:lambda family phage portal protein